MSDVSVKALQAKVDEFHRLTAEIKSIEMQTEERLEPIRAAKQKLELELIETMQAMEIKRFDGTVGKISLIETDYVNMPKTEAEKEAFFNYLKNEGLFDEMASIHYQKLNSFYKAKVEEAVANQTLLNIPGLEPKTRFEIRPYKL